MTVANTNRRNDATGNGATDTYSFNFRILDDDDLVVTVEDTSGNLTTLVKTTDYTVSGVGVYAGGSIALVNGSQAWLDADGDLKTGYDITIRRRLTITQLTDLRNRGGFFPEDHETVFDRLTMICLQQQDELDRSLKLPETEAGSSAATTLPTAANRASKFLAFDASGNPIASSGSGTPATAFAATVLDDTTADDAVQTYVAALTAEVTVAKDDTLILGDTSEAKGNKVTLENMLKVLTLLTAETAPATADELLLYDASAAAIRKMTLANVLKVIGALTSDSSPLLTDEYVFYDPVGGSPYKATLGDILKIVNSLTEDTTPDTAADFALVYDASAAAVKKVLLSALAPIASQPDQETGTSLVKYVAPGRQHYHPSAAKSWYHITYSGGTPTLAAGYGVSSITDSALGKVAINFSTSFSSTAYGNACASQNSGSNVSSDAVTNKSAGSVVHEHYEEGGAGTAADPVYVSGVFYGDL